MAITEKQLRDLLEHFKASELQIVDKHYPGGDFVCSDDFIVENAEAANIIETVELGETEREVDGIGECPFCESDQYRRLSCDPEDDIITSECVC
jgi:hypothetical protein